MSGRGKSKASLALIDAAAAILEEIQPEATNRYVAGFPSISRQASK